MKDTPKKGEQMPAKKLLMPDKSAELPIKKQWTGSPSSDRGSETDHNREEKSKKKKKRKKKEPKSEPTMATDLKAEETEERQEKCQRARKWKAELKALQDYHESCNIFLHNLPERGGGSHMGYLQSHILDTSAGFFIKSFKAWEVELQKQSQGIGHSAISARHKLQMLKQMYAVKLSTQYNMRAEYLVEVFKYPGTGNRIPMDAADGYGSTLMIGLYGLVEPYSIVRITTTQFRVVGKAGRRSRHPSATAHFATTWCKTTLWSTITFAHTCICPCSAPLMGVSTLNMAETTCGFTLTGSTIYPPDMWQYHCRRGLKARSESPIECRRHLASELNVFPRSACWVPSLDVLYSTSCS